MNEYKYVIRLLMIFLTSATLIVFFVLYVDPFQIYHKPLLSGMLLNENQRYQNAGLINSYLDDPEQAYDAAAFGTSASANFSVGSLSANLGWKKPLRLFLAGGSPAEIRQLVLRAVESGKVKHILLEMDLWSMNGEYRPADNATFPLYLYNSSRLDDIKYFVDVQVFWEAIKTLFGIADSRNGTPELLGYWADGFWVKGQHEGLNNKDHISSLAALQLSLVPKSEPEIMSLSYPAMDNEMLPLLQSLCNKDIEVVLFVPPYSVMYFLEKEKDIYSVVYLPRYILKDIEPCKNIRLHAFDTLDFTLDLNNYKDHRHYLLHVSDHLLAWMGRREHVLTMDNIAVYEQQWLDKLNHKHIYSTYPSEPRL
jgi:hypothetical protein